MRRGHLLRRTAHAKHVVSSDPTAWGYRPASPVGWTVQNGGTISISETGFLSQKVFIGCTGSAFFKNTEDLIFIDCNMYGSLNGAWGKRISYYACRFGGTVNQDGIQVRPNTSGGARPEDYTFQGCSFTNITRNDSSHTDGIQFGGILRATVRHCYFENVSVEMILCNGWNGKPENVLIDQSYFGTRTDPGGPPIHFSTPGAPHTWAATNCTATGNFYDGTVASVESGTVGCSHSGTRPRSEWTHADPWDTY